MDPLVLIPGLLSDETTWAAQIEHFRSRYQVIVPKSHFAEPTIAAMAARTLEDLPGRFILVGWSMGGYISFEMMRQAPDRVLRLGLVSTSARADAPEAALLRRESVALAERESPRAAWEVSVPDTYYRPERIDRGWFEELARMNDRLGVSLYRSQQEAIIARADSRPLLAGIRVPTFVLCGAFDQRTPPDRSWEIASGIHGAELHILAQCGHCSPIEDPAMTNSLLDAWLARSPG
jgi:pimeloyl-ACP methyl ester carboxylesterase